MPLRNDHAVGVFDDVATPVQRVHAVLGVEFPTLADGLPTPFDTARFDLFEHRAKRQVDAVRLHLCVSHVTEFVGDELPALEHGKAWTPHSENIAVRSIRLETGRRQ